MKRWLAIAALAALGAPRWSIGYGTRSDDYGDYGYEHLTVRGSWWGLEVQWWARNEHG